jgi:hypothetical protein
MYLHPLHDQLHAAQDANGCTAKDFCSTFVHWILRAFLS